MVKNSQIVLIAWEKEKIVDFARFTTDYVFNRQINNMVVDHNYRGQAIDKSLVNMILSTNDTVTYILSKDKHNEGFY